jgi:hypothetical protein
MPIVRADQDVQLLFSLEKANHASHFSVFFLATLPLFQLDFQSN